MIPGCLFFVEMVEVPTSVEAGEIPDFAELSLESIAPFPIEQLNWGYLYREGSTTLVLYAAHRDRLMRAGYDNLTEYAWALPDFATLAGARFAKDTLVALEGQNSLSLLYFRSDAEIPQSVCVDILEDSASDSTIETLRTSMKNLPATIPVLRLAPVTATLSEKDLCVFEHTVADQSKDLHAKENWQRLTPTESQLWQADVRSTDFKTDEYSKRQTSAWIGRITGWAAIMAIALIGIEGVLVVAGNLLKDQLSRIDSQRVAVSKVEEKQILVNKLEQVAQNELRPIEMLEVANNVRLKLGLGIEYDSVIVEGENTITIEGKASSVNALNRYAENLKGSGQFELLAAPEYLTRAGKTTFKVSLAYTPPIAPEEPAAAPDADLPASELPEPSESIEEAET